MSTTLLEPRADQAQQNGSSELCVYRPQQALSVTESSRTLAEVQAALTVAAARPRDQKAAIDRISTACQRPRLAESAAYVYNRGGQEITGPSIRLLEAVATSWGNIQFGFRELAQSNGESTVEAFAWDLETNTKRTVTFVVPHRIGLKGGRTKTLTDSRDVYEWVANQAQRRVRACLENVVPRDVVEDALDECHKTLRATDPVTPEKIGKLRDAFEKEFGVTPSQIEQRLQRRLETITPAQMVAMRRIYNSLRDGMSQVGDWFQPVEEDPRKENRDSKKGLADKLKERGTPKDPAKPAAEPPPEPAADSGPSDAFRRFQDRMDRTVRADSLIALAAEVDNDEAISPGERELLLTELNGRIRVAKEQG